MSRLKFIDILTTALIYDREVECYYHCQGNVLDGIQKGLPIPIRHGVYPTGLE